MIKRDMYIKSNPLNNSGNWSFYQIGVIIMLSFIAQIFSPSAQAEKKQTLYPRKINLSGNTFQFSMPEDFSKDMPAADMVEQLDITDPKKFDNGEYGNLLRRWWDIKEPGWFGKELGTIMLDISVQRVPENTKKLIHDRAFNIRDRVDFLLMIDNVFYLRYDHLNKTLKPDHGNALAYYYGFASVTGANLGSSYYDFNFHSKKWILAESTAPRGGYIKTFVIPLTDYAYLDATITFALNDNANYWSFNNAADAKMAPVLESFNLTYVKGNPFDEITGRNWLEQSNTEALQQYRLEILKLFYGPDPEKAILQMQKDAEEAMSRMKDEDQKLKLN
jgi:hypothetical protein